MTTKAPTADAPSEQTRVYVAFEGGGAKGIVHVAALSAMEEQKLLVRGYAGTSAGAIVAALACAGYRACELVDHEAKTILLDEIDPLPRRGRLAHIVDAIDRATRSKRRRLRAVDLFGSGGWWRVAFARCLFRLLGQISRAASRRAWTVAGAALLLVALLASWTLHDAAFWLFAMLAALVVMLILLAVTAFDGLARLDDFTAILDRALGRKLNVPDGKRVTFADLPGQTCLKIVAADLSTQSLRLFSSDDPDMATMPVADAVAASICIPMVFQPWVIGSSTFVDGGLVSNLPAWPFDERRELDPEATTIAVEIAAEGRHAHRPQSGFWLAQLLRTAIFGAGILNTRGVRRLEVLSLTTNFDVLDFDVTRSELFDEFKLLRDDAIARLQLKVTELPTLIRERNERTLTLVREVIRLTRAYEDGTAPPLGLAVALASPDKGYGRSIRLRHVVGDGAYLREGVLLPRDGSVTGAAWSTGEPKLEIRPFTPELDFPTRDHAVLRRKMAADLQWILCVPVFHATTDAEPTFVVVVDGDQPFGNIAARDAFFAIAAEEIRVAYGELAEQIKGAIDAYPELSP